MYVSRCKDRGSFTRSVVTMPHTQASFFLIVSLAKWGKGHSVQGHGFDAWG